MPTYTKDELLKMGEIDPELEEFLKNNEMPPVDYGDLDSFKAFAEKRNEQLSELLGEPPADIERSETHYTAEDGTKMRALVFKPSSPPAGGSPLVVLYHGGGFCIGSPEGEEQTARNLTQAFGATCVSCSYRLAPEFKFPYAPKDCWDALKWAAANAASLGADPGVGFIIGGSSAGGNLSAVLAHLARDNNLSSPLTGQYLAIPAVVPQERLPEKYKDRMLSYKQNKDAPVLPQAAIDMFIDGYAPDLDDAEYFATLNHPKGHSNLPPAFFQIDGMDPLRDEGILYADILSEEYGIKTKVNIYPGLPHGHWGFFPFLKSSAKFRLEQVEGFGWLLGQNPTMDKVTAFSKPAAVGASV